jgi:hypothetical protein
LGAECEAGNGTAPACGAQVGGHVLGGAYAARPANATAWPHRDKYFVMDLTAIISPADRLTATTSSTQLAEAMTPDQQAQVPQFANGFLRCEPLARGIHAAALSSAQSQLSDSTAAYCICHRPPTMWFWPSPLASLLTSSRRHLRALKPFLESPEAGYVNYQLPAFQDWQAGFFGGNYPRLQQIKAMYDPLGLFDKPFTVQGAGAAAL